MVLPLLLAYEVAVVWLDPPVRNGAEYAVTQALSRVPDPIVSGLRVGGLAALLVATLIWMVRGPSSSAPRPGRVLLEAFIHALWLGPLVGLLVRGLLGFAGLSAETGVVAPEAEPAWLPFLMSVGAGLWEEIVFRLGLMGGLTYLLGRGGLLSPKAALGVALAVSSLVFAYYHHMGNAGEPFAVDRFAFRAAAGTILGLLFALRGLAVVVYMHVFYDLLCDVRSLL